METESSGIQADCQTMVPTICDPFGWWVLCQ